jgi:hypothetical protein
LIKNLWFRDGGGFWVVCSNARISLAERARELAARVIGFPEVGAVLVTELVIWLLAVPLGLVGTGLRPAFTGGEY